MSKEIKKQTVLPGVSVIICCYNSAERLPQTLTHLKAQKAGSNVPWEVIVVDNGSTDQTKRVAQENWSKNAPAPLRVVEESRQGLASARHKGFLASKYEFIGFIDDDNWCDLDWVKTAFEVMSEHSEVGACGGLNEAVFEGEIPDWFNDNKAAYAIGPQGKERGYVAEGRNYLWGAGLIVRKSALRSLFDNDFWFFLEGRKGNRILSGEDSEMCFAIRIANWKLWYEPGLKLKHYLPRRRLTLEHLRRLMKSFGMSIVVFEFYRYFLKHKRNRPRILWIIKCLWLIIRILVCSGKIIKHAFLRDCKNIKTILRLEYLIGYGFVFFQLNPMSRRYSQLTDMISKFYNAISGDTILN